MNRLAILVLSLGFSSPLQAEALRVLALRSASFFQEKDGKLSGIEYDVLESFARARGAELAVSWVGSFPELLSRVEKGECDIASGTITITPEREKRVDFSGSYFPVQIAVAVRADDSVKTLQELAGSRVGAFQATTADDALRAVTGIKVVHVTPLATMLDAVARGELRGAAADSSSLIPALLARDTLKIGLTLGKEQDFGFALPKGSPLKMPLSEHILRLKESGIYFRIVRKYLGPNATEIVLAAKKRRIVRLLSHRFTEKLRQVLLPQRG